MAGDTLAKISEFMGQLGGLLSKMSGIGFWLFLAGFTLLAILGIIALSKLLVNLAKIIPNLTLGQFIKFIVAVALVLIVVGIFI